ncbi:cupin domain-containing protein [Nocardia xishanensis]
MAGIDDISEARRSADAAVRDLTEAKLVRKHWGSERWLVSEHSPFGFKLIQLTAGSRTSLHFHERKEEAFLLIEGRATLWLAGSTAEAPVSHDIRPRQVVHLQAGTIHRVEAVEDTTLIEVSTPDLDDVVRVEDDRGRGDGRIESEHRQ